MKIFTTAALFLTSAIGAYAQGPFNLSVSPANPSAAPNKTVAVTAAWTSNDGAGAILYGVISVAGCTLYYTPSKVALLDPDTGQYVPAKRPVGFAVGQNRICGFTGDKANLNGDVLSVEFLLTFYAVAPGSYPIYLTAQDINWRVSQYEQKGTLTIY